MLAFLCGYSYTKRFTSMAHFWLGVSLMLAPISAWIAIRGEIVMGNTMDLLPSPYRRFLCSLFCQEPED